jgi:hypothetical protein
MSTLRYRLSIATFIAVFSCPVLSYALCIASKDMNGVWKSNDGGTYYVREVGNEVWWFGKSGDGGRSWSNVYRGIRNGATVTGNWADVPMGKTRSGGTLNLQIDGTTGVSGFSRTQVSGGFGGSKWFKTCNDTVNIPVP